MSNILIKPVITEKMTEQGEKFNRYGFIVNKTANKVEISKAVEKAYGVTVEKVRTMNLGGGVAKKKYTTKGVSYERNPSIKKAVVTVADGDVIDLYSSI